MYCGWAPTSSTFATCCNGWFKCGIRRLFWTWFLKNDKSLFPYFFLTTSENTFTVCRIFFSWLLQHERIEILFSFLIGHFFAIQSFLFFFCTLFRLGFSKVFFSPIFPIFRCHFCLTLTRSYVPKWMKSKSNWSKD